MTIETITHKTTGTCSKEITIKIENDIILEIEFLGGCNGNLQGLNKLATGMKIHDVISKLKGIKCGAKNTSCPDQLARGLEQYLLEKSSVATM